jgi:hypothetical protein
MSSTARQQAYRRRLSTGLVVLHLELDEVAVSAMLVDAGALRPEEADDRLALTRALEAQIRTLVEFYELGLRTPG